jgi:hypothetical protein
MSRFLPRWLPRPGVVPSRSVPRGIEAPMRSTSICAKRSTKASSCEERLAVSLNYSVTCLQSKRCGCHLGRRRFVRRQLLRRRRPKNDGPGYGNARSRTLGSRPNRLAARRDRRGANRWTLPHWSSELRYREPNVERPGEVARVIRECVGSNEGHLRPVSHSGRRRDPFPIGTLRRSPRVQELPGHLPRKVPRIDSRLEVE